MLSLKIGDLVEGDEPLCSHDCSLNSAFEVMRDKNRGYVLLVRGSSPAGILTERDVTRLVMNGVSLGERAIDYASKNLVSIKNYRDIYYAMSLMIENGIRRLLVVDETGSFIGTVTMEKLISHMEEDFFKRRIKVRDLLMDRKLIWVDEDTSLSSCLFIMKENNIGALPVLRNGVPVGIITERDIVKFFDSIDGKAPVKVYMSRPVVTIEEEALAEQAVRIMEEKRIRRLVVVNSKNQAVGLISNRDIARNAYEGYYRFLETKLKHAKDVLNLLPEPTFEILDLPTGQVVVWLNAKAVENFGNLIDRQITEVVPEREWAYVYSVLLKEKRIERYRFNLGENTYELSASYLHMDFERIRGRIKLMLRDITQEMLSQKAIARELDNYQRIMDSTDDMIIIYEAESGKIKMTNRSVTKKLGYTQEELRDMTIFQIVQADPEFIMQNIQRIIRMDEVVRGRRLYRDAYGNILPVEISATKVLMNHSPYVLIVARDISERLKLEEEIEKKTRELEDLHDFILNLNRCSSEGEAYNLLSHMLVRVVGVDALAIYRVNPSLNRIVDTIVYGNMEYIPCLEEGQEPLACKIFQSVQPFMVRDKNAYSCPLFKAEYGSYMCMSVVSGGRAIALVSMVSNRENFFEKDRREFIENLVNTFSPFLSNLRLIEINRELSIRDPLTNLYNRRFILEFLQKELEKAKREKYSLSLLLIDLDHFKKINDTYGHNTGDLCLKTFSDVLSKSVRSMDIAGRWGGEEFIVILPKTSRVEAVQVANRIRNNLKGKVIYSERGEIINLTASVGVSVYPEDTEDIDHLIKVADDKLYMAKREGRDMVVP